jgi:CHAT domain-containing protein
VADDLAPHVRDEARQVAAMIHPERMLADSEATVAAVADAVEAASIVHFACHGRSDSQNPLGSGLRMHDRWLTVRDAYRLRLRNALLVLSACETGLSQVESGDELAGLLRGFFAAGAVTAVVSLWVVEDASTIALMRGFYARLKKVNGWRGVAAALRQSQCELLRKGWHPSYWAPFIMVGKT